MSDLTKALQSEIVRIGKKEVRSSLKELTATLKDLSRENKELRRRVNALENQKVSTGRRGRPPSAAKSVSTEPEGPRVRITAKGIRSLRKRLRLTQGDFGKLLGVTGQSVWKMESSEGPLKLRATNRERYLLVRDLKTHAEALVALDEAPELKKNRPRKAGAKKPGPKPGSKRKKKAAKK